MSEREGQGLVKAEIVETVYPAVAGLMDIAALQKVAKVYAASSFLPAAWRKLPEQERLANLIIIINRAAVLKCDPLLLLQNLNIIAGQMCWKSTFLLQLLMVNGWAGARYDMIGDPTSPAFWETESNGCAFSAINPGTGERETGTKITVTMIKGEGWINREGSKWRTMPEQMLKYRAVAFFARSNAPAVLGGFMSQDELEDIMAQERARSMVAGKTPEPAVEPLKAELPADIQAYLSKRYEAGVAAIQADNSLPRLGDKGAATDKLLGEIEALRGEALSDVAGFRAKYMAPETKPEPKKSSILDPGSSYWHD